MTRFLSVVLLGLFAGLSPLLAFEIKPLTPEQGLQDFSELLARIQAYYGPLSFKEKTLSIKLDQKLIDDTRQALSEAKSEDEIFSIYAKFLAQFQDGHISIKFPEYATRTSAHKIPIFLIPLEDRAIVAQVGASAADQGIEVGDEILTIDGVPPMELAQRARKYMSLGNPESDKHLLYVATDRPTYMVDMLPPGPEAKLSIKKPDGQVIPASLVWRAQTVHDKKITYPQHRINTAEVPFEAASLLAMGKPTPDFFTPQVEEKFRLTEVSANEKYLKKHGFTEGLKHKPAPPPIFAAQFRYEEKNILVVRMPTYSYDGQSPLANIQHYKAILDQYEPTTDILVIDQTHNPGGKGDYLEDFFRLFINTKTPSWVQFFRADRKWIRSFESQAKSVDPDLESERSRRLLFIAKQIEDAQEKGLLLVPQPYSLTANDEVWPHPDYHWKKPVLVLIDELSGSCGDLFPILMKRNGIARLFGNRTMGLGGNVEEVGELTYSGATVRLTRGLLAVYRADGKYDESNTLIENRGSGQPDYPFLHTVADFRAGHVGYVEAFAKAAVSELERLRKEAESKAADAAAAPAAGAE